MLISDFAIKRPLVTIVAMLALVVFGIFALLNLQTDEFPDVNPPIVFTTIVYPGASPDQVEREILDPVEEAIQGISGVDKVIGEARDGFAQITTIFFFEKDLQEATQDIRDQISTIRTDLPAEMEEPVLRRLNPMDRPIVVLALSSETMGTAELTRLADPGVVRELRSVPGVAQVSVVGKLERELTVELAPASLEATGTSVSEVVQALQLQNLAVPVGRVEGALDERTIRLKGRLDGPADFERLVVAERNGQLVRLGDVATVRDGTEEQRTLALFNDREAVGLEITKARGYSTTEVAGTLLSRVEQIRETLPPGVELDVIRNAGDRVAASVGSVQRALVEGAILTVLVVFLFLNSWRSTVITGIALPVSVLASFVAVWAFGFTLNTMSLLGLSLAIGILIDDAIVVRENIVRHVEMGKSHFVAAHERTDEIGLAVAATTFSIVAVFVPVAFMYGEAGQWFKPFALTIACSVLVSLFVSFSLDPMLSAYWPDPHVPEEKKAWITRRLDRFNAWFDRQADNYRKVIRWALEHRLATAAIAVSSFVVALAMPAMGIVGGSFFPADDQSEIFLGLDTPPGSNLQYTRLKAEEAAGIVRQDPNVLYTFTSLGNYSGSVDEGNVYVKLRPKHERSLSADEIARGYREKMSRMVGATVAVFTSDFAGDQKQLQLQIRGHNPGALQEAADMVLAVVNEVEGAVDVGLSTKGVKPELEVQVNRGLAGTLGITVGQVAQALRPAFAGIDAGKWTDPGGETRDVVVRLDPASRTRASDLQRLPLAVPGNYAEAPAVVPLGQVASVTPSTGPAIINHLDRESVIVVEANTSGRSLDEVRRDIETRLESVSLPAGVRLTQGGEVESQQEVFTRILTALGIAVMLMYLILVLQFGSFIEPLAILLSIPLSLIGVMMALLLTGNTINIMSMIAMILLAGIVAKNAILLIDFAKWSRERGGLSRHEAIIEAGAIRLRPIIMTTFALVAGMLPVALGEGEGGEFRAPLGIAVIGGVITSTMLTLLVIPTVYDVLAGAREWVLERIVGLRRREARLGMGD